MLMGLSEKIENYFYTCNSYFKVIFSLENSGLEDGSQVGEGWAHLLLHPTWTLNSSSEKWSEQSTES